MLFDTYISNVSKRIGKNISFGIMGKQLDLLYTNLPLYKVLNAHKFSFVKDLNFTTFIYLFKLTL